MGKESNKLKDFFDNINEIDLGELIEKLNNINFDDLKKIKADEVISSIKKSPITKPFIGFSSAIFLGIFILTPSIKNILILNNKANQYKSELIELPNLKLSVKKARRKAEKISSGMTTIKKSMMMKILLGMKKI